MYILILKKNTTKKKTKSAKLEIVFRINNYNIMYF